MCGPKRTDGNQIRECGAAKEIEAVGARVAEAVCAHDKLLQVVLGRQHHRKLHFCHALRCNPTGRRKKEKTVSSKHSWFRTDGSPEAAIMRQKHGIQRRAVQEPIADCGQSLFVFFFIKNYK